MADERDLNGLPRAKLTEVLESFRDPDVFNAVTGPWKSRVVWQGRHAGPRLHAQTTRWTWTSRAT